MKQRLAVPRLGIGLWLAAPVASALVSDDDLLDGFRARLVDRGLEVVTLNGFPYDAFQDEVVKKRVYRPDWSEPERVRYTLDLARVLHALLPDDVEVGSISTLPVGWRDKSFTDGDAGFAELAAGLQALEREFPRHRVRIAVEPEPGCIVETLRQASELVTRFDSDRIGLCLDACHAATQFEDVRDAVSAPVYKAQLSAALRVADPENAPWLPSFVEPRFLHQTRSAGGGSVDDLDEALATLDRGSEWRTHFHVPLDFDDERTTQKELLQTLDYLVGGATPITHHLEVETYTWGVLPEERRPVDDDGLVEGIAREISWAAARLEERGLKRV